VVYLGLLNAAVLATMILPPIIKQAHWMFPALFEKWLMQH
jgi:hypothetical protein